MSIKEGFNRSIISFVLEAKLVYANCGLSRTDVASFSQINARKNNNMVMEEAKNSGLDMYSPK